jgi:hypothetical protein
LQVQLVIAPLCAGEIDCFGHSLHTSSDIAATIVLYFPASHEVHGADPSLDFHAPAGQALQSKTVFPSEV